MIVIKRLLKKRVTFDTVSSNCLNIEMDFMSNYFPWLCRLVFLLESLLVSSGCLPSSAVICRYPHPVVIYLQRERIIHVPISISPPPIPLLHQNTHFGHSLRKDSGRTLWVHSILFYSLNSLDFGTIFFLFHTWDLRGLILFIYLFLFKAKVTCGEKVIVEYCEYNRYRYCSI